MGINRSALNAAKAGIVTYLGNCSDLSTQMIKKQRKDGRNRVEPNVNNRNSL
jgi:hypothetical protein